jgi:hypothetical protein
VALTYALAPPLGADPPMDYRTGFELDADGEGAADGWYRWKQLNNDAIDEPPHYRLEPSDKAEGRYAQACHAPKKQGGIGVLREFAGQMKYDVSIRVKVLRGEAVAQGHGVFGPFGWNEVNTTNAGR